MKIYRMKVPDELEISFLTFVQNNRDHINGQLYPNMPGGSVYHLQMDEEYAMLIRLRFGIRLSELPLA